MTSIRNCFELGEGYLIAAAIDLGTTYSGYAFSLKTNPENIHVNKNWAQDQGFSNYKTPTAVLVDADGQFLHFGEEAETYYSENIRDQHSLHIYRHFKMSLYGKKLKRNKTITSNNGRIAKAMDIFAMSLKYLKEHLLDAVDKTITSVVNTSLIRWVITVPAIWTEESKQFMREAAHQAGLTASVDSKNLVIALEPEAASVCCRRLDVKLLGNNGKVQFQTGVKYLVLDCGGGTVDIAAHEIISNGRVKEIHIASGGDWGGTRIDEKFQELMVDVFGNEFIDSMKTHYPRDWLCFINTFEKLKNGVSLEENNSLRIFLPWAFGSHFDTMFQNKALEDHIRQNKNFGISLSAGALVLNQTALKSLFLPTIEKIINHVEELWKFSRIQQCSYFFLVGGFSESCMLQETLRNKFDKRVQIIIPNEAQMAVMKGAVLFGHDMKDVQSRIARMTYGFGSLKLFNPAMHKPVKKTVIGNNVLCKDVFNAIVTKGEEVCIGQSIIDEQNPARPDLRSMDVPFYCLDDVPKKVQYTDDEGVQPLGYIHLDLPQSSKGMERVVALKYTFGETEIKVEATDLETGQKNDATLNFLVE